MSSGYEKFVEKYRLTRNHVNEFQPITRFVSLWDEPSIHVVYQKLSGITYMSKDELDILCRMSSDELRYEVGRFAYIFPYKIANIKEVKDAYKRSPIKSNLLAKNIGIDMRYLQSILHGTGSLDEDIAKRISKEINVKIELKKTKRTISTKPKIL